MGKTIQRPLACRNAHCGAMCFPLQAEEMERIWDGKPSKCPFYERRDDLYRNNELLDQVKKVREEIQKLADMCGSDTVADVNMKSGLGLALEKIDKLIESES